MEAMLFVASAPKTYVLQVRHPRAVVLLPLNSPDVLPCHLDLGLAQ